MPENNEGVKEEKTPKQEHKFQKRFKPQTKCKRGPAASDSHKYNDPSYYGMSNPVGKQAANVSTAFVYGKRPTLQTQYISVDGEQVGVRFKSPNTGSIMLIKVSATMPNVNPSIFDAKGGDWNGVQSFDRAMVKFLIKLRGSKTATLPWDAADLGVYTLSMGSILMLQGFIERTFVDARRVLPNNMLSPQALLDNIIGSGGYSDLINNYGDYMARYMKLAELLGTLPMPGTMPYFKRARSMCARWYTDEAEFYGSNQYGFVPNYLFKYNATKESTGGGCDVVGPITRDVTETGTFSRILDIFEQMLDALVLDEDVRNIGAWMVANWEDAFYVSPTFDPKSEDNDAPNSDEILSMIMNSSIIPAAYREGVIQDAKGRLLCKDYSVNADFKGGWGSIVALIGANDKVMNSYHDFTPEDAMVYSRFLACFIKDDTYANEAYVYQGDLFVIDRLIVVINTAPNVTGRYEFTTAAVFPRNTAQDLTEALDALVTYSHFDYAPTLWYSDSDFKDDYHIAHQRQSHLLTMPNATLHVMNQVAIQAQFGLLD